MKLTKIVIIAAQVLLASLCFGDWFRPAKEISVATNNFQAFAASSTNVQSTLDLIDNIWPTNIDRSVVYATETWVTSYVAGLGFATTNWVASNFANSNWVTSAFSNYSESSTVSNWDAAISNWAESTFLPTNSHAYLNQKLVYFYGGQPDLVMQNLGGNSNLWLVVTNLTSIYSNECYVGSSYGGLLDRIYVPTSGMYEVGLSGWSADGQIQFMMYPQNYTNYNVLTTRTSAPGDNNSDGSTLLVVFSDAATGRYFSIMGASSSGTSSYHVSRVYVAYRGRN